MQNLGANRVHYGELENREYRIENTDSYLKRFTPGGFDTVSLRVEYHRVHFLSK